MTQMSKRIRPGTSAISKAARSKLKPRARMRPAKAARPATPKHAAACCQPIDALLNPELFRALCDPTRASLVACIAKCGRGCSVSEVAECCSVDLSVVSRHLSQLAGAGVLHSRKEGRTVYYGVRYSELTKLLRRLADAIDECCPEGRPKGGCGAAR